MQQDEPPEHQRPADPKPIHFGPLLSYLGYQIRQAQSAVFRDFPQAMAGLEVTPGEFGLLTLVDANPGISQVKLTSVYRLDKSTLSLAVSGLVKRGLLQRVRSTEDQRYYALWLNDEGRELLRQVTLRVEEQERAMDAVLRPGERDLMLDMLRRISRAFEKG